MRAFFHPDQRLLHPRSCFSRERMREPQEVPDRMTPLLLAAQRLGFDVQEPQDQGLGPLRHVHGDGYLAFLQTAHARWKRMPADRAAAVGQVAGGLGQDAWWVLQVLAA